MVTDPACGATVPTSDPEDAGAARAPDDEVVDEPPRAPADDDCPATEGLTEDEDVPLADTTPVEEDPADVVDAEVEGPPPCSSSVEDYS